MQKRTMECVNVVYALIELYFTMVWYVWYGM